MTLSWCRKVHKRQWRIQWRISCRVGYSPKYLLQHKTIFFFERPTKNSSVLKIWYFSNSSHRSCWDKLEKKGDYKPTYISISRTLRIDWNEVKTYSTNDKLNGDEPGVIPRWRLSSNTFLLMIFFFFLINKPLFFLFSFCLSRFSLHLWVHVHLQALGFLAQIPQLKKLSFCYPFGLRLWHCPGPYSRPFGVPAPRSPSHPECPTHPLAVVGRLTTSPVAAEKKSPGLK